MWASFDGRVRINKELTLIYTIGLKMALEAWQPRGFEQEKQLT
jgi:hypothetical protein